MNYSDPGELSWVDEGLADTAAFLNGYDMTGSHLTYQQVFHRETSLTRWGGGLENYGASFSYFAYLWEQAGGNGGGNLTPDLELRRRRRRPADQAHLRGAGRRHGRRPERHRHLQRHQRRRQPTCARPRTLFQDWAVTMYLDDEGSTRFDLANFDLGPASGGWTIDVANDEFWDDRGNYRGRQPESKWDRAANRPDGTALPFGVSYEKFRNPGPRRWASSSTVRTTSQVDPARRRRRTGGAATPSQSDTDPRASTPRSPAARRVTFCELALHRGGLGLRLRRGPGRR